MNEQETQTLPNQFWIFYRMNFYLHLMFLLMALAVIVCSFVMLSLIHISEPTRPY